MDGRKRYKMRKARQMDKLIELYHNDDVSMKTILSGTLCKEIEVDLTLEEAFDLYNFACGYAGEE